MLLVVEICVIIIYVFHETSKCVCVCAYIYIYIYIYSILSPVKPELGVIPSGQEIIHEWIFKFSW